MGALMRTRTAMGLTRWGALGATVAILVLINLLGANWFVRLDLTADKEFTPSQGTRDLLAELDDTLLVRGYFTANLPPPYNRAQQAFKDLLDEYKSLSGGKLRYEFVDPADLGPDGEQQMAAIGIPMVQVTDVSSDKMQVINGFMGAAILWEDKREILPLIQGAQGLEFMLTSRIRKITGTGRTVVGLMQGFGAPDATEEMARTIPTLAEQYEIRQINLEEGEPIGSDVDVLLIVSPTEPLSDWALAQVDGFLAGGGGVGLFAGGVAANLGIQSAADLPPLFGDLPDAWGIEVARDLVADRRNVRISVAQRRGMFTLQNLVDYPFIPSLTALSEAQPVVAELESVFLPFVSSVRMTPVEGIEQTVLVESSPVSWRVTEPYDISPLRAFDASLLTPSARGPHTLALSAQGTFPNVYAGREVSGPADETETVAAVTAAPGRLIVVGSGEWLRDEYLMGGENLPFIFNAVDWLAKDEGLIALRSRGVTDRPLKQVSPAAKQIIKVANVLAGAVLLIVIGLIRWKLRQARRRKLESMM